MLSKKALREREEQAAAGARQANLFEIRLSEKLPIVMGRILEITGVESDSYDTVQAKEAADQAVQRLKAPFEAVADLWVSAHFGHEFAQGDYEESLGLIGQPDELLALPAVEQARKIVDDRNFFHWELAFPEVFYNHHGQPLRHKAGFDAVVGNPPYVKATDDLKFQLFKKQLKQFGSSAQVRDKMVYETLHLKWDLYIPFLEQAYNLLAIRGQMGLIIPDSYAITPYAAKSRTLFATQATVRHVDHFPDIFLFPGVSVHNMIVICERTPPDPEHVPVRRLHTDENDVSQYVSLPSITQAEPPRTVFSPLQATVRFDPKTTIALGRLCYINKGGTLQSHDIKFRGLFRKADLLSDVKDSAHPKPYVEGKDIGKGFIEAIRYLEYGEGTRNPAMVMEPRFSEMFENEKLLFGKTSGVYWDRDGLWCDQSARVAVPFYRFSGEEAHSVHAQLQQAEIELSKRYALGYLFAVCYSKLVDYYLVTFSTDVRDKTPETIKSIPIRRIAFTAPADERVRLVGVGITEATEWIEGTERVSVNSVAFSAFSGSKPGRWLDARLDAEPEQADVVHDLLAHLAEQMIAMNKGKQATVEAFWLDLEGVTEAAAFEILRNRGKQERTLWKKATVCRPFVRETSHATRRLDQSLSWSEEAFKAFVKTLVGKVQGLSDLVGVYRKHHSTYRELIARIEATDGLIDQIVYKLYGLMEEEIAIVEGRGG